MTANALIVGAGSGISASFAHALVRDGYSLALAARSTKKLEPLAKELKASLHVCDASDPASVTKLFTEIDSSFKELDLVLFNASYRTRGPVAELDPEEVRKTLLISAYAGFLVGKEASKRMLKQKSGAIFFTGASASVKGYPQSAPFAMGKFALRGLSESMARELHPHGIHVAHFVIDGGVRNEEKGRIEDADAQPDSLLDPDAIAETYMHVLKQPRSAWSTEVAVRPWVERF